MSVGAGRSLTGTTCQIDGALNVAGAFSCTNLFVTGTVGFNGASAQTIPAGAYANLTVNNSSGVNLAGDALVSGSLLLSAGTLSTGTNTLTLTETADVTRDAGCPLTACFIASDAGAGGVTKLFNAGSTPAFTFHVGTIGGADDGYTPVALSNITAGATGDGLNVRVVDTVSPASISTPSITRYWQLTENPGADITTDLTFAYLDGDDNSIASPQLLRVFRNSFNACIADCVDESARTAAVTNVSDFSPWTIAQAAPTAAAIEISGRVFSNTGRGVANAILQMTGANGEIRYAMTNQFGYYRFGNVPVGATFVISPRHKRFEFDDRIVTVMEEINELNFSPRE